MGIFDGCLLASDIDGTLLLNGEIPKINLEKIDWFKSEGGIFTLSTGRTVSATKYSYDLSHANAPVITFHGGAVYDFKSNEFLYHKTLPKISREILEVIAFNFPNIGVEIHSGTDLYEVRKNSVTQFHIEYENLISLEPNENMYNLPWTKVLFGVYEEEELKELIEFTKRFKNTGCSFINSQNKPNARFLEILPEGVNKGVALNILKEKLGAKISFGIGDFYNDVQLLKQADYSAATADAPDEVKALANYVTKPCKDGAVADFIDKIALYMKGSSL